MTRVTRFIARTLSFRLSLTVLIALATLLMVSLLIMFSYSRKAVKEEALLKASQTLETMIQNIDNILLSVEQSSGNIYWKMYNHANDPAKIEEYRTKLIEGNPYIIGCSIIMDSTFNAIDTPVPRWTDVKTNASLDDKAIISFCIPIFQEGKKVGVLVADVSLKLLSEIVYESKPSPNSYCILLGGNGSFIVHPNSKNLNQSVFSFAHHIKDPTIEEVAKSMVEGQTGYKHVVLNDQDCYVFYKPFERAVVPGRHTEELGWSACIIYPEDDIFGDYNQLLYIVMIIAIVGLLLLLLLCQTFIHQQLLPLRQLANSAHRIAEGHYDEPIPDCRHQDEIGQLHQHFQKMQQSLSARVNELKLVSDTLQERGEVLQAAYDQAEVAERMKTSFLYNASNQMMAPVRDIYTNVMNIEKQYSELTEEEINKMVDEIQQQGGQITDMLNQLIVDSEKQMK